MGPLPFDEPMEIPDPRPFRTAASMRGGRGSTHGCSSDSIEPRAEIRNRNPTMPESNGGLDGSISILDVAMESAGKETIDGLNTHRSGYNNNAADSRNDSGNDAVSAARLEDDVLDVMKELYESYGDFPDTFTDDYGPFNSPDLLLGTSMGGDGSPNVLSGIGGRSAAADGVAPTTSSYSLMPYDDDLAVDGGRMAGNRQFPSRIFESPTLQHRKNMVLSDSGYFVTSTDGVPPESQEKDFTLPIAPF